MRIFGLPILCCAVTACEPGSLPGTEVGRYQVHGALLENACGDNGLPAEDPLDFEVQIRQVGDKSALWILGDPPGTQGTLDENGDFLFARTSQFVAIEPKSAAEQIRSEEPADYWSGNVATSPTSTPGCVLQIEERVAGRLEPPSIDGGLVDGGVSNFALSAVNEITVTPARGSDCRQALVEAGGPFASFPCAARYELNAERVQ